MNSTKDLNLANMFQWMINHQTIGGLGELGLALQWLYQSGLYHKFWMKSSTWI